MPKTVLYVSHTAQMGGAEIALVNLLSALDKNAFSPIVALASSGPLVHRLQSFGIETHILPLSKRLVDIRKDSLGIKSLLRVQDAFAISSYVVNLAGFIRRKEVALVHTNSLKAGLYGNIAARLAGVPSIWHVRDHIGTPYLPGPAAALFRLLIRVLPSRAAAVSQSAMRCLGELGNAVVVRDGIPCPAIGADTASGRPEKCIIGMVGRIAPWKGQHIFLKAAAIVLKAYPSTEFWIAGAPLFGEDEYERGLHALVDELGITESVRFLGFREDVPELLRQMSAMVHASIIGEPFGQVVVEAMAAGKPVVATRGGALPEIVVDGETGLLVPMDDANAMAGAIGRLIADPEFAERLGQAGYRRAIENFTIEQTARDIERVYGSLLGEHQSTVAALAAG